MNRATRATHVALTVESTTNNVKMWKFNRLGLLGGQCDLAAGGSTDKPNKRSKTEKKI